MTTTPRALMRLRTISETHRLVRIEGKPKYMGNYHVYEKKLNCHGKLVNYNMYKV